MGAGRWAWVVAWAGACGGAAPDASDVDDTDVIDTEPPEDDTDVAEDDSDATADDTDVAALDLAGWWIPGPATEPSGACGYTGARLAARRFAADGGAMTIADVYEPSPSLGATLTCTRDGDALVCARDAQVVVGDDTVRTVTSTRFGFAGDGTATAAVELAQTCVVGDCAGVNLCTTTFTYGMSRVLPPDPGACAAPPAPTGDPAGGNVLTGSAFVVSHDAALAGHRTADDLDVTDGEGADATWLDATRWTTTVADGGGWVRVAPAAPELYPTTLELATWASKAVSVPLYDRRTVDGRVLAAGHHPAVDGLGHLVVTTVEWGNGGAVQSTPDAVPPVVTGAGGPTMGTTEGLVFEWTWLNLCPGPRTISLDYGVGGACWVEAASDTQVARSLTVDVAAGEVTRVNLRCPLRF